MRKLILIITFMFSTTLIYSQGSIPMKNKSFVGALEFLPKGNLAEGYSRIKSAYPMHIDPIVDPQNWYEEEGKKMRGIVKDAVLIIEWWTTASSPLERSKFDWTSSGYFEISYVDSKGQDKFQRIDRYNLEKYPNLLQRFDNLKPIDIDFEITFESGGIPDKEYYDFRKKYKIMESLGSAGYAVVYTRKINGDFIALNPSGKKQEWTNPGMNLGGWKYFLNIPASHADKESRLIELFKIGRGLNVISFKISKIKWRMEDFVYIAKKFEDYETGKDKPTAFDEVANGDKENKAGDGFWDETDMLDTDVEPYTDYNTKTLGLKTKKRNVKTFNTDEYWSINKLGDTKYFVLESRDRKSFLVNKSGQLILVDGKESFDNISQNSSGDIIVTRHLTSYKNIKSKIFHFGGGPSGSFSTEQEAINKINNFKLNTSGVAEGSVMLGFTNDYGVVKVQLLTLNQQLVTTNKSEEYRVTVK